ncbi:Rho GTPase activation protein [Umbelopsis sp. AD052]|nr:Rho GTPase activation protein [Umbelopsis sp. AD052]
MRDKKSQLEVRKGEFMAETLPEWKVRSAEFSSMAKETGMEWSKRGRDAVDRWKKDRMSDSSVASSPSYLSTFPSFNSSEPTSPRGSEEELHIFGTPLEAAVAMTRLSASDHVPGIVRRCIDYLDECGIDEVGIYRISGGTTTVNKLRAVFDSASDIDFRGTQEDPHAVSALLKTYLRQLPEPIIPLWLNREFNQVISQATQEDAQITQGELPVVSPSCIKAIAITSQKLPPANFSVLKTLCWHLNRIANNDQVNKMNTSNLGLIFIPTLAIGRVLFHCFVEHADQIWGASTPPATVLSKRSPPALPRRPVKDTITTPRSVINQYDTSKDDMAMPIQRDGRPFRANNASSPSLPLTEVTPKKNDKEIAQLREKFEKDFGYTSRTPPEKPLRSPRPESPIGVDTIRGNYDRTVYGSIGRTASPVEDRQRSNSNGKSALEYFRSTPPNIPPKPMVASAHSRQKSAHQPSVTTFSESTTKPRSKSVSASETEIPGSRKGARVMAIGSYFERRQ